MKRKDMINMKKIFTLVLVLVLCFAMVAMAEQANPQNTKVPSPTAGPRPTNPTETAEADATVEPEIEPVPAVIVIENANVETAPFAEIQALIAEIKANVAAVLPTNVLTAVSGKDLVSATIATFTFDTNAFAPNEIVPLKVDAPVGLKENDKVSVIIGIKNVYGTFDYQVIEGIVAGGKIVFDLQPEMWQSMQGQANTRVLFFA